MIGVVTDCLPPSSFKLSLLKKFSKQMPQNTFLLTKWGCPLCMHAAVFMCSCLTVFPSHWYRVVECALLLRPSGVDVAQTTLAEYLATNPYSPPLWKLWVEYSLEWWPEYIHTKHSSHTVAFHLMHGGLMGYSICLTGVCVCVFPFQSYRYWVATPPL